VKLKRYTEEQIVGIVKKVESGNNVAEICRQYGISEATIHRWRKKYGGLDISEVKRMKQLEAENTQLKKIVAQQAMDINALQEVLSKKW
jgi:putative transposase